MSAPNKFPWNRATAVKRVQCALDGLGGIEGLCKDEIPVHYIMASNWVYARELEALGAIPVSHKLRARYAIRAKLETEVWDAMVLIMGISSNGHFDNAYRIVKRTIGERPGKPKGRKPDMQRNAFIVDWIEILKDAGGLKLKDAYAVLADVLQVNDEVIRKGAKAYCRAMEHVSVRNIDGESNVIP